MANNTTSQPIIAAARAINSSVREKNQQDYPAITGTLSAYLDMIAIDIDIYSEDGNISRDKLVEIFGKYAKQAAE